MKSIRMFRDFDYRASAHVIIHYRGECIHVRVPERAVQAILNAEAGEIVLEEKEHAGTA